MSKKKSLVLFSGGRDSLLSTCKTIEEGGRVAMITYDNGCSLATENVKHGADRVIKRFGKKNAEFLGVVRIIGKWRDFFLPFKNMKPSEILKEYGEVTYSQFQCLTCRTSMYIDSIIRCKQFDIDTIIDGARESQGFAIELEPMVKRFRKMFKEFGIDWKTPVWDLKSDWERECELMEYKLPEPPTFTEMQCLLGVPLDQNPPPEEVIQGTVKLFDKFVLPKVPKMVEQNKHRPLVNSLEIGWF